MKVSFSSAVRFVPEWNGNLEAPSSEQVSCMIRPVETADLLTLMDAFQSAGGVTEEGSISVNLFANISLAKKILDQCQVLLPKYITELVNLQDDSGNDIPIEYIPRYSAFLPLAMELLQKMADISMPRGEDEKNLSEQPG